jgi:long-chain acyl-CoA synthetase
MIAHHNVPVHTSAERKTANLETQSVNIGNHVRRNSKYPDALIARIQDNQLTAYHSFKNSAEKFGDRPCLGKRITDTKTGEAGPFVFLTYKQTYEKIKAFASGLRKLGVEPNQHVGIFAKNCVEWQVTSEACHTQSIVTIALYDTLGKDSVSYILNHGEITCLCFGEREYASTLAVVSQAEHLKIVVGFGNLSNEQRQALKQQAPHLIIHTMDEVIELGKSGQLVDDVIPTPETLATIMYTSGTTGVPKGVMITHGNCMAFATSGLLTMPPMTEHDVMISYLPLGHILERCVEITLFTFGGAIGFYRGELLQLVDDIKVLEPTFFPAVPRILDKLYDKIQSTYQELGFVKKFLFDQAFSAKKDAIANGTTTPIWDRIIFNNIKSAIGGRVRGIIVGGAPVRPIVQSYLRIALDCPIIQGYGATETTSGGGIQNPNDDSVSNVGPPIPCVEIRLESVPEMKYLNTNDPPTGEVCIRGLCVSKGYYKDPEKTKEVFDQDGWYHTGDVGRWNKNGTLSIIDRVKNIFKLCQGEYIASEALETKLGTSKYLTRLWIYGDSFRSYIVGVGVVNPENVLAWAKENNVTGTLEQIVQDPRTKELVLKDLENIAVQEQLKGFEFVKAVHLTVTEFESFGGTTPTLKLKRNVLLEHFKNDIDNMYAQPMAIKSKL